LTRSDGADRTPHKWQFKSRFRRGAFGWRSHPAIERVDQAVAEIRKVARTDRALAAEGAVSFLERVSGALERVDSSSGAIGGAVNDAIAELAPLIGGAGASAKAHAKWLERLWVAYVADEIPYIELLGDYWGDLCPSAEVASAWAERLLPDAREALAPRDVYRHMPLQPVSACLSALYRAGRYDDVVRLGSPGIIWHWQRWVVKALVAQGRKAEAIAYAERCRDPHGGNGHIDAACEEILLSSGSAEEAYRRYALTATGGQTYVARFRAVQKKYPSKPAGQILADLVATTPGSEGKWFAAAKSAGLYDEALALAARSPADPKTLARAARDMAEKRPAFAVEAGLLALRWLVEGYGYEITGADVLAAYSNTLKAAKRAGTAAETRARIGEIVGGEKKGGFVTQVLAAYGGVWDRIVDPTMPEK